MVERDDNPGSNPWAAPSPNQQGGWNAPPPGPGYSGQDHGNTSPWPGAPEQPSYQAGSGGPWGPGGYPASQGAYGPGPYPTPGQGGHPQAYGQVPYPQGYDHAGQAPYGYGAPGQYPMGAPRRRSKAPLIAGAVVVALAALGSGPIVYHELHNSSDSSSAPSDPGQGAPSTSGQDPNDGLPSDPGSVSPGTGQGSGGSSSSAEGQDDSSVATRASTALSRGVVLINTVSPAGEGAGTGMVLTANGEVLTSYHVVNGSTQVRVTVASTHKAYPATVVGRDQTKDIALLKLQGASGLATVSTAKDAVNEGTAITAVGNASGRGYLTQVKGSVVALDQSIRTSSEAGLPAAKLTGLIQTSANVVPGDSGGPLYDRSGQVVGINAAAAQSNSTSNQSGVASESFSVPISTALGVIDQARTGRSSGTVIVGHKAMLGVRMNSGSESLGGAMVSAVTPGGAADKAGVRTGDTINAVNGVSTSDSSALMNEVATLQPGAKVTLSWTTQAGAARRATVTLGASPYN